MLTAIALKNESLSKRCELINSCANITPQDSDILRAKKYSSVINSFLDDYFSLMISEDNQSVGGSILDKNNLLLSIQREIENFKPSAISVIHNAIPSGSEGGAPKNIYQLSKAFKLSAANTVTRNLSTTMGLLWERIANLSPFVINPESEFGIKIKGIDLISKNPETGLIEYKQLKTQRNTLTGSQVERSVIELSLHDNPVFCACFSLGSWTFGPKKIPRISGREFWEGIGIDYDIFEREVVRLIKELEQEYTSL